MLKTLASFPTKRKLGHHNVRSLWTTTTSTSSSLSKAVASCLTAQQSAYPFPTVPSPLCVVLATPHYPGDQLLQLPRIISSSLHPTTLMGTIVDSISGKPGLSIALLHPETKCVGFTVDEQDVRRVKSKAVGRWPEFGRKVSEADGFDVKDFWSVSTGGGKGLLPDALERLKGEQEKVNMLLTFSDREPHHLLQSLDEYFPSTSKIGLVGSMTPFITGHPHTLFFNDRVLDGGVVGAALIAPALKPTSSVEYKGLQVLGEELVITSCRGNIILSLDGSNAAKELLSCMKGREMSAGVDSDQQLFLKVSQGDDSTVYRITGGDPSKGTLAIDTVKDLCLGMRVQFMQRIGRAEVHSPASGPIVQFVVSDVSAPLSPPSTPETDATISSILCAGSEGGFVVGNGKGAGRSAVQGTLVCDVPEAELKVWV
ncbi:uncharacterized protein SPPG_03333 [Spizellomyces punctatus DAOM BR117]|uniref:FIST domain-containing protein n=1 Tax=Spizellomyces punctatus (strain DAOM BR117) TaxID=645134 RepID=A0A0L0HL18_SPIPD|nr:uncharacterized protein SPPG_03333 [Spizellomyces punctatus DAOM BR117]KND01534.1 hypothetical protein SPPG_03333 [Spizellomyces punctatus DAOM BR117]|eukprot:XP_016609573.1 hypothetical protein SPPG_03333 [Spizellomyces punctatus DAOM BR117]